MIDATYLIELGQKIRVARKHLSLTQEQLAQLLGFSRISLVHVEAGKQRLKTEELYNLCCALHLQPNELFPPVIPIEYKPVIKTVEEKTVQIVQVEKQVGVSFTNPRKQSQ